MNADDIEELRSVIDDAALIFEDADQIALFHGRDNLGRWSLSEMVEGMLDVMESDEEADDMLDMSRHFASLSRRIRQAVGDHVQPRGEP
jgi:hypothetical protein